jgi:hypothetical protein
MATLGGYGAVNGSGTQSGNDVGGRDNIDVSNTITVAGSVETFSVYLPYAHEEGYQLKLKIWRLNGSNYDFIGESQAFEMLSEGLNSGLTLSSAITGVQVGDYIGVWLSPSSNNRIDIDSDTGSSIKVKGGDNGGAIAIASCTTSADRSLCVEVYGTAAGGGADTTPDAFSFTDQTDVALSTLTPSNTITVAGIDAAASISITGGEFSINAGSFTSTPTTVDVNDTVQLRVTSSGSNSTAVTATLTIGGVSDVWSVTTLAAALEPLTLNSISYATTFNDIGLFTNRTLSINALEYATTFQNVGLHQRQVLSLNSLTYTATLQDVTLTLNAASGSGTLVFLPFSNNTDNVALDYTIDKIHVYEEVDGERVFTAVSQTTDAVTGALQISHSSLVQDTTYTVNFWVGDERGVKRVTAV